MTVTDIAAVAAGGFAGAVFRYLLSRKLNNEVRIPYGTLLANLLGCLLIGFVLGLQISVPVTYLLVTGVAGALTTFSTWMKEVVGMMRLRQLGRGSAYLLGSIVLGVACVYAGYTGSSFF